MKNLGRLTAIAVLVTTAILGFIIDEDPIKPLLDRLNQYTLDVPQEKIYIQTDRSYYTAGDTIWFKSYLVNAAENRLSVYSKIIYLQLIGPGDSAGISMKLPLLKGLTWGDIPLPDTLSEGTYRLRAYTNWMRNFGPESFFERNIDIGPSFSTKVFTSVKYNFSQEGEKELVKAQITVTDQTGQPVSDKEVGYIATLGTKTVGRGREKTDTNGSFQIKFTNAQGKAFTSGLINARIEMDKNTVVKKILPIKSTSDNVDVQFFPEGGQLVDNLTTRIAFKAVGSDGLSRDLTGTVINSKGEELANIQTVHAGMGSFSLTPEAGNVYTAKLKFGDGSVKQVNIPASQPSGYVLSAQVRGDLLFSLQASDNLKNNGELSIVATQNGLVKYAGRKAFTGADLQGRIPASRLSTGIVQLTLFSPANEPVAERLIFFRNDKEHNLSISTDKQSYSQRQKVNLSFVTSGKDNQAEIANLSVAVINETKVPPTSADRHSILSDMLLTSDLKGYIEDPGYYFEDAGKERDLALDNLLLTQGWRRFTWKNVMSYSRQLYPFKPEHGINISGQLLSYGKKPVPNGKVTVMISKNGITLMDTVTDSNGRFAFNNLPLPDSATVVIQGRTEKGKKNIDILLDRVPAPQITRSRNFPGISLNVDDITRGYLASRRDDISEMLKYGLYKRNILLDAVTVVERRVTQNNSSNLNGAGRADYVLDNEKIARFATIEQALITVPGVIVRAGIPYSTRSPNTPMQIILDGMPMDTDILQSIIPADVQNIEVLRTIGYTSIYGMRGGGGVLLITTRRGDANYINTLPAPGLVIDKPKGYTKTRVYYSPNYETSPALSKLPDKRSTVYWQPNVSTDSLGRGSCSFFTAAETGTYKVTAEGISGDGGFYRKVIRFNVK